MTARSRATAAGRAAVRALGAGLSIGLVAACGGGSDLPTRQEIVDRLAEESDGLITEDVGSCVYDAIADDPELSRIVAGAPDGEVPAELQQIALDCLTAEG
jgi:hypothetical protein